MALISSNGTEGSNWSAEEVALLKQKYPSQGPKKISKILGRTETAVRHKASRLKIKAYEGGVRTRQSKKIRDNAKKRGYKDINAWKREVLTRDNFTCQDCGLRNPLIVIAHHIVPINDNPLLKFDISNGVTLCPNCHALRHVILGRKSSGKRLTDQDKERILELADKGEAIEGIATLLGIDGKTVYKYIARRRDWVKKDRS